MPRTFLAGLTGLLAAVLLPVSIVSVWVDGVVSDTDKYVETVTPLADDEVVQQAAVRRLEREALSLVSTSGNVPAAVDQLVHLVVQQAVTSPAFRTAWAQANRTAHEQLIAVLEDRSGARLDEQGRVTIELGTVLNTIVETLAARGLVDPDRVPEVRASSFPVMDADQLAKAQRTYDILNALGFWLPLAWAVLVLLTLLLCRRRLATTAKLAVASLLTLGLTALALVSARDVLTADLPEPEVAQAVWDVVVASLWRTIAITAGVLGVVAVAAGVAALVGRGRSPSGSSPDGALEHD